MTTPKLLGRQESDVQDDQLDPRASTVLLHSVTVPFEGGAVGEIAVSVFRSVDVEDRGGIVLRVTLKDMASSFVPFAKVIPSGIELHMAGDIEAKSLVHGLKTALLKM